MGRRIGSLFSGAGGLDLAVQEVFGGDVAWHAEIDKAASKVLAHRFPGVPNLGDISAVDWAELPAVDVLCGGFPCQDVSAAGKRAGIKAGTRSGLWSVFADATDALRPQWVVIENVRGLLSATAHRTVDDADGDMEPAAGVMGNGAGRPVLRAAGAVLGDLADLGYDAQWATVAAADVGAPHRRERVFILASRAVSYAGHDAGRPEQGVKYEEQTGGVGEPSCRIATDAALSSGAGLQQQDLSPLQQRRRDRRPRKSGVCIVRGFDAAVPADDGVALLPTPRVGGGGDCESERRRNSPGLETIAVTNLLPTPISSDCHAGKRPDGRTGGDYLNTIIEILLPTPSASDSTGGGANPETREAGGHHVKLCDEALANASRWGKYAPAIARWERIVGPAPAPTEPNKNGNPRLSAAFSEWLMGWPQGWVTHPDIGISRNDQLRIIGNGVCPQQATAALRFLLAVATGTHTHTHTLGRADMTELLPTPTSRDHKGPNQRGDTTCLHGAINSEVTP